MCVLNRNNTRKRSSDDVEPSSAVEMYLQVLIVSFVLVLLGALVGFLGFPMLFEELVKRVSQKGNPMKIWQFKKPFLAECES